MSFATNPGALLRARATISPQGANTKPDGITPNAGRLMWTGFMAILAAGVGFGVRGGIFAN